MRLLYRLVLGLLPEWLRLRAGREILDLYDERQRAAPGRLQRWVVGARELVDLVSVAARSRLRRPSREHESGATLTRRSRPLENFFHDLRHARRTMLRRPGPTLLAVLMFGLGIAASTAMFSVVDAVLLRPLPFPDARAIVSVYTRNDAWQDHPSLSEFAERGWLSYPEFEALSEVEGALEGLAVLSAGGAVLYEGDEPERIPVGYTTPDLFSKVLKVTPLHGRVFTEEDDRTDRRVAVLTEGFWQRRFGGDPAVIGTALRFGDSPVTIIGVIPQEAAMHGWPVDAWSLIGSGDGNWANHWLRAIGRLSPGVSRPQAEARLAAGIGAALPAGHDAHGIRLFDRHADETQGVRGALALLSVAALVLLLVACGNVAALLVGAAIDRQQELAVRSALGAGRGRLIRQLLTESVLLSGIAALVGVALTVAVMRGLVLLAPDSVPRVAEASVNLRVLGFAVAISVLFGIVFGLIPALAYSRADLRRAMTTTARGSTGSSGRLQATVVVAELALATVLLVGGGLLGRTVLALNAADPGFAVSETLGLRLSIPFSQALSGLEGDARVEAADAYYRRLLDGVGEVRGVRAAGMTDVLPLSPDRGNNEIMAEGLTEPLLAERRFVSANYFTLMDIRIVDGRTFEETDDRPDAPLHVIVSEGLARRAWPDGSAVGRRFNYWDREGVVIGVAADIRDEDVRSGTAFAFYVPRRQAGQLGGSIVLRTDGDPVSVIPALRQRIREIDPGIAVIAATPLSDLLREDIAAERYRARLVLIFSALAGLFAVMGIYGVTARSVAARTRELGIRKALGAPRAGILGLVLGQAVRLAMVGAGLGVLISLLVTRGIEAYLWGVPRTDALTLLGIAALLGAASVLAALAPGRRAARIDPNQALRME